jgi:hypothetical protein
MKSVVYRRIFVKSVVSPRIFVGQKVAFLYDIQSEQVWFIDGNLMLNSLTFGIKIFMLFIAIWQKQ